MTYYEQWQQEKYGNVLPAPPSAKTKLLDAIERVKEQNFYLLSLLSKLSPADQVSYAEKIRNINETTLAIVNKCKS